MKRFSLRYSLLTYKLDQLWFPFAFLALFMIMTALIPEKIVNVSRAFLGCAIPLIGGILSAYAVLDDPALELRFSTPVPSWQTLLERLGLIFLVQMICALIFQLFINILGADLSILGSGFNIQMSWLIPTISLMALGCTGSLLAAQSVAGALLIGVLWLVQLILRGWFALNRIAKYFLVFMGALMPDHPALNQNYLVLALFTFILIIACWAMLKKQERYI